MAQPANWHPRDKAVNRRRIPLAPIGSIAALLLVVCVATLDGSVRSSAGCCETFNGSQNATRHTNPIQDGYQARGTAGAPSTVDGIGEEASWPMAGANPRRTSWTSEEVRGTLDPIWYRPIEPYISKKTQIIAANNLLYISTARGLYALDADTGDVEWIYPTELPLGHSPTIHNGVAYVGGFDHKIHAMEANPDMTTLPVDPTTGHRVNDRVLWTYEAGAGFQTNPLIVDNSIDPTVPVGEGRLYAGNRDGTLYAIHVEGPDSGQLAWSYPTGGPVLFSAAYKDGVIYFASNDAHAYALDATDGSRVWKSAKLPGAGFHSWWPVVYTDPQTQTDYVIFAGSNNYRFFLEPGPLYDIQQWEINDLYVGNGIPVGETIAPLGSDGTMTATLILEYYEDKPWRRNYFLLEAATGDEFTFDYRREDGTTGTSYAPITWAHTHGAGNRYPPLIGSDGLLYQPMHYRHRNPYIADGSIVGWQLGAPFFSTTGHGWPMDEPVAYSAGGDLVYWVLHSDLMAGAFDITMPLSEPNRNWVYYSYDLASRIPGYDELYSPSFPPGCYGTYRGTCDGANGVYGRHGEQAPPIPYRGKVYLHRSNAILAFGNYNDPPTALPTVPQVNVSNAQMTPGSTDELNQELSLEVQKILDAGHLRPGYLGSGLFDIQTKDSIGDYLLDYWRHPADTHYALLLALPHLPASQQISVTVYLQNEFAAYPPYQYTHIGWRDGAAREPYELPPEVESDRVNFPPRTASWGYSGWEFPPHTFYALWKYSQAFGGATEIFDNSSSRLESVPPDDYLAEYPYVHNAYIAGFWGYLELEKLAAYPESSDIRTELARLLDLRATSFSKDSPLDCDDRGHELNVARNFIYLVPELGQYLHDHALLAVQEALEEYSYVAPYWFVTKTEQTRHEGVIQPLYDSHALFQARALILKESREELLKYLDVPAFARGDLFHLQKLVAAIEALPFLEKTATPPSGYQDDTISYTLSLAGNDSTLVLTDTLPLGASAPITYELEGTSVMPTYHSDHHTLTWTDTPTAGLEVTIGYTVSIVAGAPRALTNTAELRDEDGRTNSATATVIVNPYLVYLPLVLRID